MMRSYLDEIPSLNSDGGHVRLWHLLDCGHLQDAQVGEDADPIALQLCTGCVRSLPPAVAIDVDDEERASLLAGIAERRREVLDALARGDTSEDFPAILARLDAIRDTWGN